MELLFPGSSGTEHQFFISFVELRTGVTTDLGMVSVVPYEVSHASGAPAYALRVMCDGKVIAYSGDTEETPRGAQRKVRPSGGRTPGRVVVQRRR